MNLGEIIKNYRATHHLTMEDFAKKTGLSKGYISMLEKNRHPQNNKAIIPSIETFRKVATAMHTSIDDLMRQVDGDQPVDLSVCDKDEHAPTAPTPRADERELLRMYERLDGEDKKILIDFVKLLSNKDKYHEKKVGYIA